MSCARLIGRLLALFVIFIFVVVTPPLMLAYNAQEAALSGDFLDEFIDDLDAFEELIPEIAEDLARDLPQNLEMRDMPIARLDADGWERVLEAVAPPQTLQRWTRDSVEGFRRWVRRGGRFLDDVILPFGEARDNMINDPELTVLRTLTEAQPTCRGGQEPLAGPDDLIPQCQPPAANLEAFYQRLGERWREQPRQVWRQLWGEDLARYPDDISLADFIEEQSDHDWDTRADWRATRWGLRIARWFLVACVAVQCLTALGLVVLFAARNWREALRWAGSPLVLAGAFALLLALLLLGAAVGTWFIPDEDVPVGLRSAIEDTAQAFASDVWPPMAWQGGILFLIGLGMWVLSFFAPGERAPARVPVTAPPAAPPRAPVEPAAPAVAAPVELAPEEPPPAETDESEAPTPGETPQVAPGEEAPAPPGDAA
jgi:hypothetical protein